MSIENKYSLIDAKLSPEDANEIITELIKNKINFHNLKNFSSVIRYNKPHIGSREKIVELKKTKERIIDLINFAKTENKNVVVYADIVIRIED
ncbi:MAG TPA: hypothetical protein PK431_15575 [Chitinophagales bacterium]|nr:hypothetical protein [Chitinophagales bacterium]